jgi:hypothetical protein
MGESEMLNRIEAVQWASFAQPEWNKPHSVVNSLSKVIAATDAESCSSAYDSLLYSVGNNHAGTYYPVLLATMPFLEEILLVGPQWPQRAVLCALDDLYASFHPEPGYEKITIPETGEQEVEVMFRQSVRSIRSTLECIVSSGNPNSSLARELLSLLSDDAA